MDTTTIQWFVPNLSNFAYHRHPEVADPHYDSDESRSSDDSVDDAESVYDESEGLPFQRKRNSLVRFDPTPSVSNQRHTKTKVVPRLRRKQQRLQAYAPHGVKEPQ